ncbi:MAG: hypothetical protein QM770_14730 [Tepidisphaeraceae bacterium]
MTSPDSGARDWYRGGVARHYADHGAEYANPHAPIVHELLQRLVTTWTLDLTHVLDLAAGAGEVTVALQKHAKRIDGIDPFTGDAYRRSTGQPCEALSFEQIAAGACAIAPIHWSSVRSRCTCVRRRCCHNSGWNWRRCRRPC